MFQLRSFPKNLMYFILFGHIAILACPACSSTKAKAYKSPEELLNDAQAKLDRGKTDDALFLLEQLVYNYRAFEKREQASFLIVKAYLKNKDYAMTVAEGRDFVRDFPGSDLADDAQFLIADALYRQSPSYALDQTTTREAVIEFNTLLNSYPKTERRGEAEQSLKKCINKLAEKDYENGCFYARLKMPNAATVHFESALKYYPDSDWADDTMFQLGKAYIKSNKAGEASDTFNKLITTHPDSKWIEDAKALIDQIASWDGAK